MMRGHYDQYDPCPPDDGWTAECFERSKHRRAGALARSRRDDWQAPLFAVFGILVLALGVLIGGALFFCVLMAPPVLFLALWVLSRPPRDDSGWLVVVGVALATAAMAICATVAGG